MVAEAVDRRPSKVARAIDDDVVAVDVDSRTERTKTGDDSGDPVRFLVPQLTRAVDHAAAARLRRREAQDRDLVDRRGGLRRRKLDGLELRRSNDEVRDRLASVDAGYLRLIDRGGHPSQQINRGPARRVGADV